MISSTMTNKDGALITKNMFIINIINQECKRGWSSVEVATHLQYSVGTIQKNGINRD